MEVGPYGLLLWCCDTCACIRQKHDYVMREKEKNKLGILNIPWERKRE